MKKKIAVLLTGLLIVLSMNFIFADEPVIQDVEVSAGHLEFDAAELAYDFDVDYDTEVLTFTPMFTQSEAPAHVTIVLDGETVLDPVADEEDWIYDTVDVELLIGDNVIEMVVTEDPDTATPDDETETTYTFTVTRNNILEELDVYVDDVRVDLVPEFDSNTMLYTKLITMPDEIILDFELAELLEEKTYRVVVGDTIIENEDQELLDDSDVALTEFLYGENIVDLVIETNEGTVETPDWQEYETYTVNFEIASLESISVEAVDEGVGSEVVTLVPEFAGDVIEYTAMVGYEVDSLDLSAVLIDDPENDSDEDSVVAIHTVDATSSKFFIAYESGNVVNYEFDGHHTVDVIVTVTNGDSEIVYTITVTKEGRLETLEFSYEDDEDVVVLEMTPEFDATDQAYVVEVPHFVDEVALEAALPTELDMLDIYVDSVLYDPEDNLMAVAYGQQLVVVEIKDGDDVIEEYGVTLERPMPLISLDIEPVGDYGFDPSDYNYNIGVENEVDEIVLTPTAATDVEIYIDGDLLETDDKIIALDEGKNTIKVMTMYDGVSLEYVLRITRDKDEDVVPPKDMHKYRYMYENMDLDWDDDNLEFGPNSYRYIVQAFKWGNNKNNEIVVPVDDDEGTLTIPYHIYKFMVQRKVTFVIEYEDEEYRIELAELKLSRYIKGPNAVQFVILEFDIDDGVIEVEDEFEGYESLNKFFKLDHDDDDDDDDDEDDEDDDKPNKHGKFPPGKNK